MDPRYAQSTKEERDPYVLMHHQDRVRRALTYIRAPAKGHNSTEILYFEHDMEMSSRNPEEDILQQL
ncbi:hypothetical protein CU097_011039 [Rhizopus azygosporus]|uniref:Uncharacterized protein n=1 Tax=Rhizopus azygosporus TaxID=86630 RepID=A0A367KCY3_RHIAZ|nr:hypothetical protein CU097_011039 [Rhizopus azygosporus]